MSRHVVVTGAANGIGLAVAHWFAARGDRLTLVDHRAPELAVAAAAVADAAGAAAAVSTLVVDLRGATAPSDMIGRAWATAPVDVLVNAAGVYPATPFRTLDAEQWDAVLSVNLRAPLLATVALAGRAAAADRRPCVVNISSGAALRARPGAAPYSTSKAALEMATRASALELGADGIRVNAVAPGFVAVDSTINAVSAQYASAVSGNPLGRVGAPEDIAKAVGWLADDEQSGWVTGTVLRVDGGSSAGAHTLPLSDSGDDIDIDSDLHDKGTNA